MLVASETRYCNPLAFPAGYAPRFDPSHPAARGIGPGKGFSGVASGGNIIDLLTGSLAAQTGTITSKINGRIGPGTDFTTATTSNFAGKSTATGPGTCGAIIFPTSFPNHHAIMYTHSTAGGGWNFAINSSQFLSIWNGSAVSLTTFTISANTPYFVAMSATTNTQNFLALNLLTGRILTERKTDAQAFAAGNGTYAVGVSGVEKVTGVLAAVSFAPTFLTVAELMAWAADPWSFWYPDRGAHWIAAQAVAGMPKFSWQIH